MKAGNTSPRLFAWLSMAVACLLAGCAASPPLDAQSLSSCPWAAASTAAENPPSWKHQQFPGKRPSVYRYTRLDDRDTINVQADSSASMLRQAMRVEPVQLGYMRFSWKVPALIESADLSVGEFADSPVRVVLAFEGDRSKFSPKNAMLSELAQVLTGEPMPYATLVYVWANQAPVESVIVNPRTDRIRKVVMESGPAHLNRWLDYERDIRADFAKAFGEPPGALVAIGIMTDTDNTHSTAQAWYGPLQLVPPH